MDKKELTAKLLFSVAPGGGPMGVLYEYLKTKDKNDIQNELHKSVDELKLQVKELENFTDNQIKNAQKFLISKPNTLDTDNVWSDKFAQIASSFNEWHMTLLAFLDNPVDFAELYGVKLENIYAGSVTHHIKTTFPQLDNETMNLILDELTNHKLISGTSGMCTGPSTYTSKTTNIGKKFLNWLLDYS